MNTFDKCGLCDSTPIETRHQDFDVWEYKCSRCNIVRVKWNDLSLIHRDYNKKRWLLSAFCRKMNKQGMPPVLISYDNVREIIENQRPPNTLRDAEQKVIEYLGDNSDLKGSWTQFAVNSNLDVLLETHLDLNYVVKCLFEEEDLVCDKGDGLVTTSPSELDSRLKYHSKDFLIINYPLRLTPEGRDRYDQLKRSKNKNSNQVFIAMWYNSKTMGLREPLRAGIKAAGYDPIFADTADYTGLVMDFVLASIRESKFVIADFTADPEKSEMYQSSTEASKQIVTGGVRGGVYYEAGFAKGLGLEVIHTCKNDDVSKTRLHFDVKQMQTIYWNDLELQDTSVRKVGDRESQSSPKNFAERIHDRIVNIFGYGPGFKRDT